ncbi:DNA primase [Methylophaga thiooxydans]|uniref:DNA primase n=1 Tax=Methylophaga thiooxydans DMS010 TaxID=637616 RepID=C0N576_9GAMM|nr:DNA primase [Methylophaga thiooxydans]EEF79998.1 DNA primase [Methylophaga thiooxydans DMS010]
MAGQIPTQFIDELLARVDIVDIIDTRVPLKKAGKNLHACCPFHNEKTPSFTVSQEKQFYHCFGCGAHGTAIGFLMEYDQLSFPEAIQELADHVGMTVPTTQQASLSPVKQSLYDLMDKVGQYYVHQLQTHPQRQAFVDYLKRRGLSQKTVELFGIGMAPDGWDNVLRTFGSNPQQTKQLLDGGLLIKNDKGRTYDRFRNRIMFPIWDRRGRVIGFGGRVLDDSTPKYLNSPETPIFHKGAELYGLYQARKANRKLERIVIVEGYMDVIALAEHGISNAVATLGTSTTADHLRLLLRAAPEVVFCFDGDRAGRDAAWRAAENALPMLGGNQQLKFMFLPDGEDPDSLVSEQGAEAFNERVVNAQNYSEFFFETLGSQVDLASMDGRARLVEMAKPYLKHVPAGVYRDMLEQRLAELSKTNIATLNKHLEKPAQQQKRPAKKQAMATMTPIRMAITIVLQYPILAREIDDVAAIQSVKQPGVNILQELLETLHQHPHLTTAALLERWRDKENGAHLQKLALQPLSLSADALKHELTGIVSRLQKEAKSQRINELTSKPFSELTEAEKAEVKSYK